MLDPGYRSEQPAHPERRFHGRDRVRRNWSLFFEEIRDLQAELMASAVQQDTEWAEWRWHGTRPDGDRLEMTGVTVMGVRRDRIVWGRL